MSTVTVNAGYCDGPYPTGTPSPGAGAGAGADLTLTLTAGYGHIDSNMWSGRVTRSWIA